MPGRDGTGPYGEGPLTGRGLGPCGRGLAFRGGLGRGFGRGFGFRRVPAYPAYGYEPVEITKEQKIKVLETERAEIEAELKELEKEIQAIKNE